MTSLLDGAMGTALLAAGLPAGDLPERWILERPDEVARVHAAHARAGAEIVLTCTFNLAAPRLWSAGVTASVRSLAREAVGIARAAAPRARVAGALGPLVAGAGAGAPELARRYAEAFGALASAGADLLWAESQLGLAEARAALSAGRDVGLPTVVTFALQHADAAGWCTALGEDAVRCAAAIRDEGAAALGVNCVLPGLPIARLVASLAAAAGSIPVVAKPSAGLPGAIVSPPEFAALALELRRAGASWFGGCCGASAEHLAAASCALAGASEASGQPSARG